MKNDSLIESTWKMFERNSNDNKQKNDSTKSKLWIKCWEFMLWVFCKYALNLTIRECLNGSQTVLIPYERFFEAFYDIKSKIVKDYRRQ